MLWVQIPTDPSNKERTWKFQLVVIKQMTARIINAACQKHREQMQRLAEFAGLDEIRYVDHGNKEDYFLVKGDKKLTLTVAGNQYDGGFLCVSEID